MTYLWFEAGFLFFLIYQTKTTYPGQQIGVSDEAKIQLLGRSLLSGTKFAQQKNHQNQQQERDQRYHPFDHVPAELLRLV